MIHVSEVALLLPKKKVLSENAPPTKVEGLQMSVFYLNQIRDIDKYVMPKTAFRTFAELTRFEFVLKILERL